MKNKKILFFITFIASLFIFFWPVPQGMGGHGLDKYFHAGVFVALVTTAFWAFPKNKLSAGCLLFLYGPMVELLQKYIFTYRSFDLKDVVADYLGLFIGLLFVWLFIQQHEKQE